jgi:hypothetical protein
VIDEKTERMRKEAAQQVALPRDAPVSLRLGR